MNREQRYEFLEHTADVYIAAYGGNLPEAFENAAEALFEVMTEVEKVEGKVEEQVEVEGGDKYSLLYNWLEELIIKTDVNGMLYSKFNITDINKTSEGFRLKAKIWGEELNQDKHPQKVGVKAVTYHRMEILENENEVTLKFILDI
ncbi:MAG: archease [Thermoproteota archaeon]